MSVHASLRALVLSAFLILLASPVFAGAPRLAVFDFELIDSSLQGELKGARPEEMSRLSMIGNQLRDMLSGKGGYAIVDLEPAADAIAEAGLLRTCSGCAAEIARTLGAHLAITGTVQKVSNLILNINVYVTDAEDGEALYQASVDIRGNTDQSWSRGLSYLARNRLMPALSDY